MLWLIQIVPLQVYFILTVLSIIILATITSIRNFILVLLVSFSSFGLGVMYHSTYVEKLTSSVQESIRKTETQSTTITKQINSSMGNRLELAKEQFRSNIVYVEKELVKYDNSCVIPDEFVYAHNKATETQK